VNVGIVVYSHTGHTRAVAQKLEERLSEDGHAVTLEELEIAGPVNLSATTAALRRKPSIELYDTLVFASPVNGGRMSAAMNSYLDQLPPLAGKGVICLVTHFLFRSWGAKQTLEQMQEVCQSKGAAICGVGSVRWSSLRRGRQIAQVVENLADCLGR